MKRMQCCHQQIFTQESYFKFCCQHVFKKRMTNFWHSVTNRPTQAYDELMNCCHKHVLPRETQTFETRSQTLFHKRIRDIWKWRPWQMLVVFSTAGICKWLKTTKKWIKCTEETRRIEGTTDLRSGFLLSTCTFVCFANFHAFYTVLM